MEVLLYPDPRLRRPNAPVERFDAALAALARDMLEVMYRTKGVGLSAPQVGVNLRLLVLNRSGDPAQPDGERIFCNPRVLWRSREKEWGEEGCLSFPGIYARVERPVAVRAAVVDLRGEPQTVELRNWEARIFQHELDHLEGVLLADRLTPSDRVRLKAQLEELEGSRARTGA